MDRLRKFWMTGACKKPANGKGKESSHSLDIVNFTSAYILLIVGVGLAIILLVFEHVYFTFWRRKLKKVDKCGCCSLLSLVRYFFIISGDKYFLYIRSTNIVLFYKKARFIFHSRLEIEVERVPDPEPIGRPGFEFRNRTRPS